MKRRISATIITGFLGAGKTTLVRHLLANAGGRRLALIINEFGDLGVDGGLLAACATAGCTEDDMVELANGCLCCTVADDFLPTMEALVNRPQPPDHIVIETSGLAIPKPLVKAFQWPEIKSRVTVDGVIAVIDSPAAADGRFASTPEEMARPDHDNPLEEVFEDQLAAADLVLLNKSDLLGEAELADFKTSLEARLRPGVKAIATRHGVVDPLILLGLGAGAEDDLDNRPSHHDGEDGHDHDDFRSFAIDIGPVADPAALEARLAAAIGHHDILRLKGFVDVAGKPARLVIQAVGPRIERYFDRPWQAGETRSSRLVVIGRTGFDPDAITAMVKGQA